MKIEIRQGKYSDLAVIAEIENKCFPSAEAAPKCQLESRLKLFPNHFYVALADGNIVGFINGFVSDNESIHDEMYENAWLHNEKGNYQMIFGLDVLPEYRRFGIANRLMNTMIESAKREGRKGLVLTCKNELVSFYENM